MAASVAGRAAPVVVALVAAPARLPLGQELADAVRERVDGLRGDAPARVLVAEDEALAQPAEAVELVGELHRRRLEHGWDLAIGLTDVPLRLARRPVAGHASPTHGVAVLSVPALGAGRVGQRARAATECSAATCGCSPASCGE